MVLVCFEKNTFAATTPTKQRIFQVWMNGIWNMHKAGRAVRITEKAVQAFVLVSGPSDSLDCLVFAGTVPFFCGVWSNAATQNDSKKVFLKSIPTYLITEFVCLTISLTFAICLQAHRNRCQILFWGWGHCSSCGRMMNSFASSLAGLDQEFVVAARPMTRTAVENVWGGRRGMRLSVEFWFWACKISATSIVHKPRFNGCLEVLSPRAWNLFVCHWMQELSEGLGDRWFLGFVDAVVPMPGNKDGWLLNLVRVLWQWRLKHHSSKMFQEIMIV